MTQTDTPTPRTEGGPCEVPFVEQLRSVPEKLRTTVEIQWNKDGTASGHQFIPVGFMMHRAADELTALRGQLAAVSKDAERYRHWKANHGWTGCFDDGASNSEESKDIDEAIDAAIAATKEQEK